MPRAATTPSAQPLFSVVVPLHDDRGVARAAIKGWLDQRTADAPFEIVVVDSGRPKLARELTKLLGPGDQLILQKSANEAILYNAGANVASADWLVLSESHVVPCPGAVEALRRRLVKPDCDAAVLGSVHGIRSRFAAVDATLCDRESSSMRALGLWRVVGLRGFLIQRATFASLGGFTEDYFRFAETALAIHLVESGCRLAEFADVLLEHYDTDGPHELISAMSIGRLGACRFWAAESNLAWSYFGSPAPNSAAKCVDPRLARQLWRKVLSTLGQGKLRSSGRLFQLVGPKSLAALTGWWGQEWKARLRIYAECFRLALMLHVTHRRELIADCQPLVDQYLRLRECCADLGFVQFQAEVSRAETPGDEAPCSLEAASLPAQGINFFPPEVWRGESYCWSAPRAAVLFPRVSAGCRIRLDARPTGGWLARKPRLYLDGCRIPAENVTESDGIVEVLVPANHLPNAESAVLSWDCEPFVPSRAGLADRRKLGVALIRGTVEQVGSADASKKLERAA